MPKVASACRPDRPHIERLTRRHEFLAVAKGVKVRRPTFTVQALAPADRAGAPARIGFTLTKKVGTAVVRNRIRRRLRALCREMAGAFSDGTDYVVVAREGARTAPYAALGDELAGAVREADARLARSRGASSRKARAVQRGSGAKGSKPKQRVGDG